MHIYTLITFISQNECVPRRIRSDKLRIKMTTKYRHLRHETLGRREQNIINIIIQRTASEAFYNII